MIGYTNSAVEFVLEADLRSGTRSQKRFNYPDKYDTVFKCRYKDLTGISVKISRAYHSCEYPACLYNPVKDKVVWSAEQCSAIPIK